MGFHFCEDGGDVLGRVLYIFDADDAAQEDVLRGVGGGGGHDAGTVDEVDAFHEGDVLPYFCFAGDGGDGADFFLAEGVDYA